MMWEANYVGHIVKRNSWSEKQILSGALKELRWRGCPSKFQTDDIKVSVACCNSFAEHRVGWGALVKWSLYTSVRSSSIWH